MDYRIRGYYGGVGDQLQFSTLPERFTELGHDVYLLKDCDQVLPYRNEQIKQLIWLTNPFIKGERDGTWDLGDLAEISKKYKNHFNNYIKNWEYIFGLEPINTNPKIYWLPNKIEGIDGIIELSSITLKYNYENVIKNVKSIIKMSNKNFHQIVSPNQSNLITIPDIPIIQANDIFHLTSLIYSSNMFISLNSGSHAIGAALKHFKINTQICYLPKDQSWIRPDCKFMFDHIDYIDI